MKMKIAVALMSMAAVVTLSACGSSVDQSVHIEESQTYLVEVQKKLSDGRKVTCIVENLGGKEGLSCDWDKAR